MAHISLDERDRAFPDVIRLESSGQCNFRCRHCPHGYHLYQRPIMSPATFAVILRQWDEQAFLPRVVVLYHGGEPLLNPHLPDYIRELRLRGVSKIRVVSNGSLLTPRKCEELIAAPPTEFQISLDGDSPEENNFLRRNGNFQRELQHMLYLHDQHPPFDLIVANTRVLTRDQITDYLQSGQVPVASYLQHAFADRPAIRLTANPARVWSQLPAEAPFDIFPLPSKNGAQCVHPLDTLSILADGGVVPCCDDLRGEIIAGNIHHDSMFHIWRSRLSVHIRRSILSGKGLPGMCRRCVRVGGHFLLRSTAWAALAAPDETFS